MTATISAREQLVSTAQKFAKDHEDPQGLLSAEDQATFDSMLAAAKQLPAGRGFRTQAEIDNDHTQLVNNGMGSGAQLFDEKGNATRGLASNESFACAIREQANSRGMNQQEQRIAKHIDDGELSFGGLLRAYYTGARTPGEFAALQGASGSAGGLLVPEFLSSTVIDKFRARTVMLKAGSQIIPLTSDVNAFVKLTGDATAAWRQELTAVSESAQTFGAIVFHPRSLAVYVKVSKELLEDAPNIETALEHSLSASFAVELDRVGLVGMGAAAEPLGITNDPNINTVAVNAILSGYDNVLDAYKANLDKNAPDPTALIVSTRDWQRIAKMKDGEGLPLQRPPAIADLPILTTTAVPTTLGSGSDSIAVLGHFPDFVFGMRAEMRIEILKELFAVDSHCVAFVAHLRCDTGAFHSESFCSLTGLK